MKTSIIAVGTELLFGQVINSNAAYISNKLNLMGFDVMYHFVVGDNPARLKDKLAEAFDSTDLVILTGGLGPTQDDLTKEIVAEYMGAVLYRDERVYNELIAFSRKHNRDLTENSIKQSYLPDCCVPFYNDMGTAPGFALENNGKIAICLPGPPREMNWLFDNCVESYLEKFTDKKLYYRVIRTIGIGEPEVETELLPFIDGQTDPTIATYVKSGECTIRVASQRPTLEEAQIAVNDMVKNISGVLGDYIYSCDDEDLNTVVVKQLTEKGLTMSSAESATGGLFAKLITDVSGASKVYDTSFVTYSNRSKIANLGVNPETIDKYSVSSPEVAVEMAEGVIRSTGSDIAVSITGNAGPDVYEGQHAGLAYVGYSYQGRSGSITVDFPTPDRNWNRGYFALMMLRTVYMLINSKL